MDDLPFRRLNISLRIFAYMDQLHLVKVILCFTFSKINIFREIWIREIWITFTLVFLFVTITYIIKMFALFILVYLYEINYKM